MKQTLKKYIGIENGIMSIFYTHFANDFETLFENQTPQYLDYYIFMRYSERVVNSNININNFNEIVKCFIAVNIERWKTYKTICDNVNNNNNNNYSETHRKVGTLESDNENTRLTADKVFNDTMFVDTDRDVDSGTKLDTYDITETITKNENILKNSQILLDFQNKYNIFAIVKQIIDYITIKIY